MIGNDGIKLIIITKVVDSHHCLKECFKIPSNHDLFFNYYFKRKNKGGFMSTKALTKTGEMFPSFFDDFFKPWNEWGGISGLRGRPLTMPAVNITENKDDYKISLAAPGLKKSDFNIDVDNNMLTISSEKEESKEEKDDQQTRREYNYSSFSRSFTLPDEVIKDKIEAVYTDGVLQLTLPKKEEAKKAMLSKHINVK
jgi:HSP20 family protein